MSFSEVTIGLRAVRIQRFWCDSTYGGVIEGIPEVIQRHLRADLPQAFRRLCGARDPFLLLQPPEGDLPNYLCAVELNSFGATYGAAGHVSYLTVGWLTSSLDMGVREMVATALARVDWERTAKSATWVEYL